MTRPPTAAPEPVKGRARQLASDNFAGMIPEVVEAMVSANVRHAHSYGDDEWTARAADAVRELFEADCEVFFVFNGTAANGLAVASLCQPYHSVLCHETAHIETDECGAPEFFSHGAKLLLLPGAHGKATPDAVRALATRRSDIHYPKPRVLSLTQATELGTVYSTDELGALTDTAKALGMRVHMDGARLANALATLEVAPKEVTWRVGVDALSFGGSKTGAAFGDAVVFFNRDLCEDFAYRCKQAGQLASKMRFIGASWLGLLGDDAWLRHARHANQMAQDLTTAIEAIGGIRVLHPRQANSVFIDLPREAQGRLRERGWKFYDFVGTGGVRLMCSWDTSPEDITAFAGDLAKALQPG